MLTCALTACTVEKVEDPNPLGLAFYLKDDGTYKVEIGMARECEKIEIPSSYNGKRVTEVGSFADDSGNGTLREVIIPSSITVISKNAFRNCTSLMSVTIGEGVREIGNYAFEGCYNLIEVINRSFLNVEKGSEEKGSVGLHALEIHTGESKIVDKEGFLFYTFGGVNYLVDYTGSETDVILPESYNGEKYKIWQYALCYEEFTSVDIGDGVTGIGTYAFRGCTSLTSVTVGENVKSIGKDAFYFCYKLVEVINHSSLKVIAEKNGNGDLGLYAKEIHKGESRIADQNGLLFYTYGGKNYLLGYKGTEAELVLPVSYNGEPYEIYKYAFCSNDIIKSITVPEEVAGIGEYAFSSAVNLESITIECGITSIERGMFAACINLTSITIPDSVTEIGVSAFSVCEKLTSIAIPDSVTRIGSAAFAHCDALTSVIIPDSVKSLGSGAFAYCDNLMSVVIGNGVTEIGSQAFANCPELVSVTIGNNVTCIPSNAFNSCEKIISITIPESVTSIDNGAFSNCDKLMEVVNNSTLEITVGGKDNGYVGLHALDVHTGESRIVDSDGFLFYTHEGVNYLIGYNGTAKKLILPDDYNGEPYEIYNYAFMGRGDLTVVVIGNSVTRIGFNAFRECMGLVSVTIPESVTVIDPGAFQYTRNLVEIINRSSIRIVAGKLDKHFAGYDAKEIHKGESRIVEQDGFWFGTYDGVNYLLRYTGTATELVLPENYNGNGYEIYRGAFSGREDITSVTVPDSVTGIGDYAFSSCLNLKTVIIGSGVVSIGEGPFSNCTQLTSVIFKNVKGWTYSTKYPEISDESILSSELGKPSMAAMYLTGEYYKESCWKRG